MGPQTRLQSVAGPAGLLQCAVDEPAGLSTPPPCVLLCHPHPLHGGTLDNKVVQTLARAFVQMGWRAVRFNFRGVAGSEGHWDDGRGELDDAHAVLQAFDGAGQRWALGGFSFGASIASHLAARLAASQRPAERLVLVGPAVVNFPPARVPPHTLVVHGQDDDVVPLADVLSWARTQDPAQPLPVTVVPGTGHFFHGQLSLLKSLVLRHSAA
jgi:hypothetical protein